MKACACQPLFARLGAIAEVVAQLGAQGMPVAAPRRTLGGAARAVTDEASALSVIVLPEVTGDFVDAGDPAAVRATGETLARVHLALAQLQIPCPSCQRPHEHTARTHDCCSQKVQRGARGHPVRPPVSTLSWQSSPTWTSPLRSCTEMYEAPTCLSTADG